jgi:hypothetical protein
MQREILPVLWQITATIDTDVKKSSMKTCTGDRLFRILASSSKSYD